MQYPFEENAYADSMTMSKGSKINSPKKNNSVITKNNSPNER